MPTRALLLLTVALLAVSGVRANAGALIRSKSGQSLTSSTLHWVSVSGAQRMPDDAIEAAKEAYACRFQHAGRLALGSTRDDVDAVTRCRIVYYGNVIAKDKFDVLVNTHQAGRLVWGAWDRSRLSFVGAVQVGDHYVARVRTPDGYRAGHLDPSVHRGRIFTINDDGEHDEPSVHQSQDGEILIEIEPIAYEVTALHSARNRRKIQSQETVQLAHMILDNMEEDPETVASTLSYVTSHAVYLSHVKGMVKGLASSIQLDGGSVAFQWGDASISGSFPQVSDVSRRLERGTGVNVSLTARRVTFDAPFTAKLATTYSDNFIGRRQIDGQARQTVVEDVALEYSPVYFLSNGSLVPSSTTTSSTSTTTSSTTTSTTTEASAATTSTSASKHTKATLEFKSGAISSTMAASALFNLLLAALLLVVMR